MYLQGFVDNSRYIGKAYFSVKERGNRDLVCCIEYRRECPAGFQRIKCKTKRGESLHIRLLKSQCADLCQVELFYTAFASLRPCYRISDRGAHVGSTQLRHDAAVDILDHRVNDALRMNYDTDFFCRHVKKPVSLDNFKAFVHKCCRINGYLCAH